MDLKKIQNPLLCGTKIIISQTPCLTDGYEGNKARTSQQ
jgi:hypothetical protein